MLIEVTKEDIRDGVTADCDGCAVAIAASRITGYHCSVISHDWCLFLRVGYHCIVAPKEVQTFVEKFDNAPRRGGSGRLAYPDTFKPFSFQVPDLESEQWEQQCCWCGCVCSRKSVDESGRCEECR